MDTLCPFFKETCHGNECVMWKNEECLLVSFLQRISEGIPLSEESMPSSEESIERTGVISHSEEVKVPKWLKTSTPEEIAVEMLEFKKKEFPEDENVGFHTISSFFWGSKGVERFFVPSEIQMKIQRANFLAQREMTKQAEGQKKQRLEREKEELPSLVSQCVDWARINGLNRLTLGDVDTYLLENDLDILNETKRAMQSMANVKLKSKK